VAFTLLGIEGVNAFHVLGGLFALWAVVVSALGLRNPDFPGDRGRQRIVIAISVTLATAAIGSAIITAATEEEEKEGEHPPESGLVVPR
jgi:hypothetical protein